MHEIIMKKTSPVLSTFTKDGFPKFKDIPKELINETEEAFKLKFNIKGKTQEQWFPKSAFVSSGNSNTKYTFQSV